MMSQRTAPTQSLPTADGVCAVAGEASRAADAADPSTICEKRLEKYREAITSNTREAVRLEQTPRRPV